MFFGTVPAGEAAGAILAHSQEAGGKTYKKGTRLSDHDVAALTAAGVETVIVARLEPGDLGEDEAARRLAAACTGANVEAGMAATGRVNIFARADGLLMFDQEHLNAVNSVDESVTVATLEPYARVEEGQLVATIKIIPLGVAETTVESAAARAKEAGSALVSVAPFRPRKVGLLQTVLPGTREKVLAKTVETVSARLRTLGSELLWETRVEHTEAAVHRGLAELRDGGCDLMLIVGASATTDRRDCIPAGLTAAGGTVEHYGMPVDPGNLLVTGHLGDVPVLALPGSARSPKVGGNDWVLWRICAGLTVTSDDIMRMGAGGLLKEIPARPLPRAEAAPQHPPTTGGQRRIAALVLAAGQSRRMGGRNKLLEEVGGRPMLLHALDAAEKSKAAPVIVVTGHQREQVESLLGGRRVKTVHNPDFADGLSTSLRTGVKALPADIDGVVVLLGDMPGIHSTVIDRLIDAFDPAGGHTICVPTWNGKRGNPVLLARRFFPEMQEIGGDVGAKPLLSEYSDQVMAVEMPDDTILVDLDTPEKLADYRNGNRG
jgi:molybdenum cofactor cytidylyltransferase